MVVKSKGIVYLISGKSRVMKYYSIRSDKSMFDCF